MEFRRCIDCGTEYEPIAQYQVYCDSFCATRSMTYIPPAKAAVALPCGCLSHENGGPSDYGQECR